MSILTIITLKNPTANSVSHRRIHSVQRYYFSTRSGATVVSYPAGVVASVVKFTTKRGILYRTGYKQLYGRTPGAPILILGFQGIGPWPVQMVHGQASEDRTRYRIPDQDYSTWRRVIGLQSMKAPHIALQYVKRVPRTTVHKVRETMDHGTRIRIQDKRLDTVTRPQ